MMMQIIKIGLFTFFAFLTSCLVAQSDDCLALQDFKIVVLGSSTAAGAGASSGDSAWVGRYRDYLQTINPSNQVINLAVGGYNTYRLMPTGYQQPTGRPAADTVRNITAGIAQNPDAIIVNLPSNDVGAGFSVLEQIANFDTIVKRAEAANIPIWICTTQPRNFSNAAQRQMQVEVRDSINLRYAPFTIDFWSTIAAPDYTIDSTYNSGDGVHLNDSGHRILFERARDTQIPAYLFVPGPYTDYGFLPLDAMLANACGDSSTTFQLHFANRGGLDLASTMLWYQVRNTTTGDQTVDSLMLPNALVNCEADSFSFAISTLQAGQYELLARLDNPADTITSNDSLYYQFSSLGYPTLSLIGDTLCEAGTTVLEAGFASGDTVFWYDDPVSSQIIGQGASFSTPVINNSRDWYAQAIRGDLFYRHSLRSTLNTNINFNGTMFDLLPQVDLIVDSFALKINTLGPQDVEIYYKNGSYQGAELDASAWTLWGVLSVDVADPDILTSVPLGGLSLLANDTTGIYIQMANANSRLSYQSVSSPQTRTTNELTMISGSGIAHDFSNIFYPRDWSGEVFYHFGERLGGECATERLPVSAAVSELDLNIGPDTLLDIADSLTLSGGDGYATYLWSNGDSASSIQIYAADFGIGIHYLSLTVTDSLACMATDEMVIAVGDLVGIDAVPSYQLSFYPNPTRGKLKIGLEKADEIRIYNVSGQLIKRLDFSSDLNINDLPQGIYWLYVMVGDLPYVGKVSLE
ncbi:MAG: GDSL-type esterase/lipase family protein [Bacteroidia bacterium]